MKREIGIIGLLGIALALSAGVRTPQEALTIASQFTTPQGASRMRARASEGSSVIADSASAYYAVNTRGGFVLVGADDRLPEVLGYSDKGSYDPENLSPEFRYWMQCYEEELEEISNDQSPISNLQSRRATAAVDPLMSCKWNQGTPYNDLAPLYNETGGKCVTGCVATAMAQVMYYHKHPNMGTGSHQYLWVCTNPVGKSATLSANFGQTVYNWSSMLDSYKSGYTIQQASAVATLMYHCGVSIDMGYGQSSGAYTEKVPVALKDYFGYDANYQRIQKKMYPADSLNAIIAAELKAQRPVIVSGHNDEGGHAFVCDGCDNRGYFHINWGWGGSNDGYYLLTALNPGKSQGIGGTTKGYNKGTCFFIGIQPSKSGTPKAIPQLATTNFTVSSESFSRSTAFSVSITQLENYGMTNFSGSYGVALYDEDETKVVTVLKQVDNYSLNAGYHRTSAATLSSIKIPSSVAAGTYHLCCVYKDANYGWMRMMCTEDDYYRTLILSSTNVSFMANDAEPVLTLTKALAFPQGTNTDSIPKSGIPVSFAVKNTGGTFRGDISARIYQGDFAKGQYEISDSVVIRYNQTFNSALQQTFASSLKLDTEYKMKLCWRAGSSDSWHDFTPASYGTLSFKLYDPDYHLSLTDTIHFDRNDSVPRHNANLHYAIRNTGAAFDGEIQLSFYQSSFIKGRITKAVHVGTNETLEGAFSGPLEQVAGTYTVELRYRETGGEWQEFIDVNNYNLGLITAVVVEVPPVEKVYVDAICEDATSYEGYGFSLSAGSLPAPGGSKDFVRASKDAEGRDSIITLTLNVTKGDTIIVPVEVAYTDLPYEADAYYTVPANTPIGFYEHTEKAGEGCTFHRYEVTVTNCRTPYAFAQIVCEGHGGYEGYGFTIAADDMPALSNSKQYKRTGINAQGCDSVITLTLTMQQNDTTAKSTKIYLSRDELPYEQDAYYTVPVDAPDGIFDTVVNTTGCSYKRYTVTIERCSKNYKWSDQICAGQQNYEGHGFSLSASELPNKPGNSKAFKRVGLAEIGCDSTITLTLSVLASDTIDMSPITVQEANLPYQVDDYYTVPVGAIDNVIAVVPTDETCTFYRYFITIQKGSGTKTDNTDDAVPARKFLRNGQLYILYNGIMYNVQGGKVNEK